MGPWFPMEKRKPGNDLFGGLFHALDHFFSSRPMQELMQTFDDWFQMPAKTFPVWQEENAHAYIIRAELPHIKKDQIELASSENCLSITVCSHEQLKETNDIKKIYKEKNSWGCVSRTVCFPMKIDEGNIKASFKNGMLKITVPKKARKMIRISEEET